MSTKKTHFIHVRISKEDEERIVRKSEKLGMTISQFMRFIAMEANVEVKDIIVSQK